MIEVNIIGIFVAAIASMIVGFVYYMVPFISKPWMKLMNYSKDDVKPSSQEMAKMYGTSFILAIITAFILSHVMAMSKAYFNETLLVTGIMTAFWMWLGFVMPVQLTGVLFEKKPFKLFGINTGYQLLSLLAMGIVIGLMS